MRQEERKWQGLLKLNSSAAKLGAALKSFQTGGVINMPFFNGRMVCWRYQSVEFRPETLRPNCGK